MVNVQKSNKVYSFIHENIVNDLLPMLLRSKTTILRYPKSHGGRMGSTSVN